MSEWERTRDQSDARLSAASTRHPLRVVPQSLSIRLGDRAQQIPARVLASACETCMRVLLRRTSAFSLRVAQNDRCPRAQLALLMMSIASASSPASIAAFFARNISSERSWSVSEISVRRRTLARGNRWTIQCRSQPGPMCFRTGTICRSITTCGEVAIGLHEIYVSVRCGRASKHATLTRSS